MDNQQLNEKLRELHKLLQERDSVEDRNRPLLRQLRTDIQALLEQKEQPETRHYGALGLRLREALEQLEAAHPDLTMLMGQMADALAKMGI